MPFRPLGEAFQENSCPEAVWKEIIVEGKPSREKVTRADFIRVEKADGRRLVALPEELVDKGEAEAIVLALELNADLLLDDRDAGNLAKRLGPQVMGTLGAIVLAKYKGLIPEEYLRNSLEN